MFYKGFFITENKGNNALSYDKRGNKPKLYVPALIKGNLSDIKKGDEVVFEDFSMEKGILNSCVGLKNYVNLNYNGKEIVVVDNHNVVFYFWYEARKRGIIGNSNTLIHFDEHSDMRDPGVLLSREDSLDLKKVFYFTNYICNVGNYIIPAQKEGIIKDIIQVRNQTNLEDLQKNEIQNDIMLNIDMDFWSDGMDYIDYNLKKKILQKYIKKAKFITIATSPFFIDQNKAISVLKDLLN